MTKEHKSDLDAYFERCLYFSVSKLQRNINRLAEEAFRSTGLAPSYAFLIMTLNERGEIGAGELSNLLGLTPSTITRFVDKLEKQKLCKRRNEGRLSLISLTAKGAKLIDEIHSGWKRLFEDYNTLYGEAEAAELNRMIVQFNIQFDQTKGS